MNEKYLIELKAIIYLTKFLNKFFFFFNDCLKEHLKLLLTYFIRLASAHYEHGKFETMEDQVNYLLSLTTAEELYRKVFK